MYVNVPTWGRNALEQSQCAHGKVTLVETAMTDSFLDCITLCDCLNWTTDGHRGHLQALRSDASYPCASQTPA